MGSTIKRFFKNRNTVNIVCVILCVCILYIGYSKRVSNAISPVLVPCAKVPIGGTVEITQDMIDYVKVSQNFLDSTNNSVVLNANYLVGKTVKAGSSIPANGLFYYNQVISKEKLPDAVFQNIPDGYTIFNLDVTSSDAIVSEIYPGTYIDLYFSATDDNGKKIYGPFINHIEVLDAKDSSGNHVFADSTNNSKTAVLLFAVPDDLYLLLEKATQLNKHNIRLVPVGRNRSYTATPGETSVESDFIKEFILSECTLFN